MKTGRNDDMSKNLPKKSEGVTNFLLYTGNDGKIRVDVFLKDETVWLTQKPMAELFGVKIPAVSKHLANIYESGELKKEATVSNLETVQNEGDRQVRRKVEFYNLDAIIAVGYRVNSYQATQFRIWATGRLREYIVKGFVIMVDYLCHSVFYRGGLKGRYSLAQGNALGCGIQKHKTP